MPVDRALAALRVAPAAALDELRALASVLWSSAAIPPPIRAQVESAAAVELAGVLAAESQLIGARCEVLAGLLHRSATVHAALSAEAQQSDQLGRALLHAMSGGPDRPNASLFVLSALATLQAAGPIGQKVFRAENIEQTAVWCCAGLSGGGDQPFTAAESSAACVLLQALTVRPELAATLSRSRRFRDAVVCLQLGAQEPCSLRMLNCLAEASPVLSQLVGR